MRALMWINVGQGLSVLFDSRYSRRRLVVNKVWPSGTSQKIVLATDLTLACDRALDRAIQLARDWKASLIVLHVVEADAKRLTGAPRPPRSAENEMARIIRSDHGTGGLEIEQRLSLGDPVERIVALAQETQSGLIVIGLAHAKGIGEKLLGSTAGKLLRYASCPVLSVRGRVDGAYSAVAVGTDFSKPSRVALDWALRLFHGSKYWLVHAYETPFGSALYSDYTLPREFEDKEAIEVFLHEALQRFAAEGGEPPFSIQPFYWPGRPDDAFSEFISSHNPHLVVIGTHGRSGLKRLTIGSVAEQLLNTLPCDVLVVPPAP